MTAPSVLRWIRLLSVAPLFVAGAAYLLHPPFRETMDRGIELLFQGDQREELRIWAEELGWAAPLATTLLMIVQAIAAPIPAVLVTVTNSLLFGWVWGGVLSILSATLAAMICYGLARGFGEPLVTRLVSRASLERADNMVVRHGGKAILLARLLPFVPFDPISFLAGLGRVRLWTFVWATILGQIPAGMTYSYLAQQIAEPGQTALWASIAVALVLLAVFSVSGFLKRRRQSAEAVA